MSKYFDHDFFKFFLGFIAIISFSLIIIFGARFYDDLSKAGNGETPSSAESSE